ncbi:MAG: response regulator [Candidatus Thiodiazotropha sp. 6PLUC9]
MVSSADSQNAKIVQMLSDILTNIEANWPVLPSGIWNASSVRSALRHLSELSRNSQSEGFVNIHELSQQIDKAITDITEEKAQPDSAEIRQINQLLEKLKQMIIATQKPKQNQVGQQPDYDLVYLHSSESSGEQITAAIEKNEWRVLNLELTVDLRHFLTEQSVKLILIDTQFIDDMSEINKILNELHPNKKTRPELIFITGECNIEIRLEVLRTGVTQCFTSPININDLMLSIKQIISPHVKPKDRVLLIEDDESQAQFASTLLRKGGLKTRSITNPLGVMEAVKQFQPDLILMDLYMPGANGIELTQVIRDKKELANIPIVFLSGEESMEKKLLALHSGADDFLTKPVRPQHLLATVKTRINRAQIIFEAGARGNIDYSTGLQNRKALLLKLDCMSQNVEAAKSVAGLFTITYADPEQYHNNQDYSDIIEEITQLVGSTLNKHDYLARSSEYSLTILLFRNTLDEFSQFGTELFDLLKANIHDGVEFGIGKTLIDFNQKDPDILLAQSETASLMAFHRHSESYLDHQEQIEAPAETETSINDFQKQQFKSALETALIEFRQQQFNSTQDVEIVAIELLPKPAPATDIILTSDNIFITAEQHGLNAEFDQYICKYALRMLGEFSLAGDMTQVIISISALAMNDEVIIKFIKSELRRLQLVGTGLMIEFDLPSLAKNLKQARYFLGELSAMGINTLLGNFACNETAYKVLAYLNADGVRPHVSMLNTSFEETNEIATQVHSLNAKIILPTVDKFGLSSLYWSEAADFVQSSYND